MIGQLAQDMAGIRSRNAQIGDLIPEWSEHETNTGFIRKLEHITYEGNAYQVTPRFLLSLASHFRVTPNVFRYFTPSEVFQRVQETNKRSRVRLTTDGNLILAVSDLRRPVIHGTELCEILADRRERLQAVHYADGVVHSTHLIDGPDWTVGPDAFASTFTLDTPIDGFGLPQVHLSVLRLVCSNGLIVRVRAFRTDIAIGTHTDSASAPLSRALDCYSNEEGFAAVRQRLDAARRSEASVRDVYSLTRALTSSFCSMKAPGTELILSRLAALTGDISAKFGVASVEAITPKKRRMLPVDCTLYDLFTFATEITSHHRRLLSSTEPLNKWIGRTLADEFDLEGGVSGQPQLEERLTPAFFLN